MLAVLDDLQWADPQSLDVVAYVARFLPTARLVLVAAYRSGSIGLDHPLARSLAELDRHGAGTHIALGPLPDDAARELVDALATDVEPGLAQEIVLEARGHPFFITEVVRHLGEVAAPNAPGTGLPVPQSVRNAVARRLAHLSPNTRRVLAVAAAFTGPFDFSVLAAMVDLDEDKLLAAIDEALQAQILSSAGEDQYEFSHALIRRALYDEMSPSRRARLHRRIAQALEQVFAGHELEHAGELAAQYRASISLPGAAHGVRYAMAAAETARATHAWEQAVGSLKVASELAVDAGIQVQCDVACRLAVAEAEALQLDEAARSADKALELLDAAGASGVRVAEFVAAVARPLQRASTTAWSLYAGSGHGEVIDGLLARGLNALGDQRDIHWARLKLLERRMEPDDAGPINSGRWLTFDPLAVAIARADGDEDDYSSTLASEDPHSLDETRQILKLADTWTSPSATTSAHSMVLETLVYQHGALREALDVATKCWPSAKRSGLCSGRPERSVHSPTTGRGSASSTRPSRTPDVPMNCSPD